MPKLKYELILIVILIPILAYVGWQAYNTYFRQQTIIIKELEKGEERKPPERIEQPVFEKPSKPPEFKGILDYSGYVERDPLKPSLPVVKKEEKPPEIIKEIVPEVTFKTSPAEGPKEIIPPSLTVTGIVWGGTKPFAIIDQRICRVGDIVKGAKIVKIDKNGVHLIYENKEFSVTITPGG